MNPLFKSHIDELEQSFQQLLAMAPVVSSQLPRAMPIRGIYLFSENSYHLYVGRTNNLRSRLRNHCRPSASHFQATFAMRIARQQTGLLKATYKKEGSRDELVRDAVFGPAFVNAKTRVAQMEIRYIGVEDALRQALLEMYVAVSLSTPFNDFENH